MIVAARRKKCTERDWNVGMMVKSQLREMNRVSELEGKNKQGERKAQHPR